MASDINIVVSAQVGDATRGLQQVQKSISNVAPEVSKVSARIQAMTGVTDKMSKSARESASSFEDSFKKARAGVEGLNASLDPAYGATLRYDKAADMLEDTLRKGVITQSEFNASMLRLNTANGLAAQGTTRVATSLSGARNQFNATAVATNKFAKGAMQQAGYQVGDFAVQISGGQNAMQAFAQQGSQLAGVFGPMGAVVGAGIAIFGGVAAAFMKTRDAAKEATVEVVSLDEAFTTLEKVNASSLGEKLAYPAELASEKYQALLDLVRTVAREQRDAALSKIVEDIAPASEIFEIRKRFDEISRIRRQIFEQGGRAGDAQFDRALADQREILAELSQEQSIRDAILSIQSETRAGALENLNSAIESLTASGNMTDELRAQLFAYQEQIGLVSQVAEETEEASRNTREAANEAASFADAMQRAANAVMNINVSAFSKLQALQAELRGRTRGLGDDEIRIMQAARSAELAAKEAGVDSSAELAGIAAEAARIERQTIAAESALLQFNETATAAASTVRKIAPVVSTELTPAMKQLTAVGDMVGNSMESALMSMVDGTKSVKDAFKSMASEIIKELYRIFVVKQITGMISGFIGDPAMFGGMGGTSPVNGSVRPVARSFAGKRAMGGQVTGGKAYMVGERGPEMIVPQRNGNVVPNNQLGGGGVTVNQTINVTTGVQQTVRTEIKTLMPQIANAAKAAVADAKLRGGSYGKAFG